MLIYHLFFELNGISNILLYFNLKSSVYLIKWQNLNKAVSDGSPIILISLAFFYSLIYELFNMKEDTLFTKLEILYDKDGPLDLANKGSSRLFFPL